MSDDVIGNDVVLAETAIVLLAVSADVNAVVGVAVGRAADILTASVV